MIDVKIDYKIYCAIRYSTVVEVRNFLRMMGHPEAELLLLKTGFGYVPPDRVLTMASHKPGGV